MGLLYNLIQRGELQQRLTRGLQINEKAPAQTLASDIQAVVLLEDLTKQTPFVQPLERRFFGGNQVPAVAAEFPAVVLQNPLGSGVVAVVQKLRWRGTSNPAGVGRLPNALVAGLALSPLPVPADSRIGPTSACQVLDGTNAALLAPTYMFTMAVSNTVSAPADLPNIVVLPGESLVLEGLTVNTPFDGWFEFVEFTS